MKKILLFAAGVLAGAALVVHELVQERLIVNNNLDGSVTLHHSGGTTLQYPGKGEKVT